MTLVTDKLHKIFCKLFEMRRKNVTNNTYFVNPYNRYGSSVYLGCNSLQLARCLEK